MEVKTMIVEIGLALVVIILMVVVILLGRCEVVYHKDFWWSTWNGLQYSRANLVKVKGFPIYYIEHLNLYGSPTDHPNYVRFLSEVKDITKGGLIIR